MSTCLINHISPRERPLLPNSRRARVQSNSRVLIVQSIRSPVERLAYARYPSKRGVITSFSANSRRRLITKLNLISRDSLPLFITLTYHEVWPDPLGVKRHLQAFYKRLRRRWPSAAMVWRIEYQARGAPHYHILLWGVPVAARDVIASIWSDIAGYCSHYHRLWHAGKLGNRHCVEVVRSWRGVMSYASKYLAKVVDCEDQHTGRYWGIMGSDSIPWDYIDVMLPFRAACALRRVARRLVSLRLSHSYTLYRGTLHRYVLYLARQSIIDNLAYPW